MRLGFDPLSSKRLVQALCGTAESCLSLRCQGLTWVAGLRCSKKKRERERRDTSAVDVVIFLLSRRKTATSNNKPTSTGRASGGGKKKAILYFVDPWIFFFTPEFSFVLLLLFVFFLKKKQNKAEWSTRLFQFYQPTHLILWPTLFLCKLCGLKPARISCVSEPKKKDPKVCIKVDS